MTAPFLASAGTLLLPSLTFNTAATTGFYLKSSTAIGVVSAAAEVASFDSTGLSVNAATVANSLSVNGSPVAGSTYAAKASNYTAVLADNGAIHRYTASAIASLTAAATLGSSWRYTVVADGGAVTIDPNASETINGLATMIVPNGSSATIICDGSNFFTVIKPSGWQTIEKRVFSGVSAVDFTNLGAYSSLQLTGRIIMSADAVVGWRSSTNNGSSYDAGASDYSIQDLSINNATLTGARTASSSFGLITAGLQSSVNVVFNDFNFSGNGCFSTHVCTASAAAGINTRLSGSTRADTTARNALRILPTTAVTLTGYLTIEGQL
ncbi:hypothetical protein [Rhizobium grahamii]|nr:hypothetical protein [Rhizobium grahamii]